MDYFYLRTKIPLYKNNSTLSKDDSIINRILRQNSNPNPIKHGKFLFLQDPEEKNNTTNWRVHCVTMKQHDDFINTVSPSCTYNVYNIVQKSTRRILHPQQLSYLIILQIQRQCIYCQTNLTHV